MRVSGFDHVAVPVSDPEAMIEFYGGLGFQVPSLESFRAEQPLYFTVCFGDNKINMHCPRLWQSQRFRLRGPSATPGCGDFCFVWAGEAEALNETLAAVGAPIEAGPVERVGGRNLGRDSGMSVYTRDPDGNLLEFIIYE